MELNELNLSEEQVTMIQKYVQSETDKVRTKYSNELDELKPLFRVITNKQKNLS